MEYIIIDEGIYSFTANKKELKTFNKFRKINGVEIFKNKSNEFNKIIKKINNNSLNLYEVKTKLNLNNIIINKVKISEVAFFDINYFILDGDEISVYIFAKNKEKTKKKFIKKIELLFQDDDKINQDKLNFILNNKIINK